MMMDDRIGGPVIVGNSTTLGDVTGATTMLGNRKGRGGASCTACQVKDVSSAYSGDAKEGTRERTED
ncbi:unnamed protein product [Chondrus crispus]|uniref:Uncharacterized protein n=1 Tax=Chondrus crispus TaxID=2769 RepID=R7QUE9_CHOCR|nr:unnamed protein product [Chondrus crispus]CDF41101.1 unnamed protein product [Chondrus crispus]|eukprot:XP_005711395.1 unnamed protein product [Chondrus crispus]